MNFYILNVDHETPRYIASIKEAQKTGQIKSGQIHIYGKGSEEYKDEAFVHEENGLSFLARYLSQSSSVDPAYNDQLVPSHEAPHVLAQVILILLESRKSSWKLRDFPKPFNLPYEKDLEDGIRAVSVTNEKCPADCSELCVCPVKDTDISWDIGRQMKDYAQSRSLDFIGFKCSSLVETLCTIPMKEVIGGWLEVKQILKSKDKANLLVATYSNCHGIAALIEAVKNA